MIALAALVTLAALAGCAGPPHITSSTIYVEGHGAEFEAFSGRRIYGQGHTVGVSVTVEFYETEEDDNE